MKLSAPVHHLKRRARRLSREERIPLHRALDRVAAGEGFGAWSLLAARLAATSPAGGLFARLAPGDLVLIGARPGHGKTLMSLELAVEAMKAGRRGALFTLEYTVRDVLDRFRAIGADPAHFEGLFDFDDSDAISADYIVAALAAAPRWQASPAKPPDSRATGTPPPWTQSTDRPRSPSRQAAGPPPRPA